MNLSFDKAVEVFTKVRNVREEVRAYCIASDRPNLSIEDFKSVVSRMYKISITVEEVSYPLQYVRGMLLRYQDRAKIYIGKEQTADWKRFTAVKELCHLVNDEQEDWSPRGADTLTGLLTELSVSNNQEARKAEQSEVFAELSAIEMLYPYDERVTDVNRLQEGSITPAKIANYYGLPEVLVRQYVAPSRMDIAREIWATVER